MIAFREATRAATRRATTRRTSSDISSLAFARRGIGTTTSRQRPPSVSTMSWVNRFAQIYSFTIGADSNASRRNGLNLSWSGALNFNM